MMFDRYRFSFGIADLQCVAMYWIPACAGMTEGDAGYKPALPELEGRMPVPYWHRDTLFTRVTRKSYGTN